MRTILRTILFITITVLFAFTLKAQLTLNSNKYGLRPGDTEKTQVSDYVNEGPAGKRVTWDFTGLTCKGAHYASVVDLYETPHDEAFPESNAVIAEHGNYFFYNVDKKTTKFYGYITDNVIIRYDQPVEKMRYPMKYGERFEGTYTGSTIVSTISGEYSVEADGYGKLIFPGGVVIDKALRVKSYDRYIEAACNTVEVETIKYLWYAKGHRYPVLVIVQRNVFPAGEEPFKKKYAVYNDNLAPMQTKSKELATNIFDEKIPTEYKVFPNPYKDHVNITYTLNSKQDVNVEVFDASGKLIEVFVNDKQTAGTHNYIFYPKKHNLAASTYFVKLMFGSEVHLKKIVGQE